MPFSSLLGYRCIGNEGDIAVFSLDIITFVTIGRDFFAGFYHSLEYHPGSQKLSITLSFMHLTSEGKPLNLFSLEVLPKYSNT